MATLAEAKESIQNLLQDTQPDKNITKSKIGDVSLNVVMDKSINRVKDVTKRRVSKNFNISDHAKSNPLMITLRVTDGSEDYLINRDKLVKIYDNGDPVTFYYSDRDEFSSIIIMGLSEVEKSDSDKTFFYDIRCMQIEFSEFNESYVVVNREDAAVSTGGEDKKKGTTREATEEEEKRYKTVLKQGVDIFK